MYLCLKGHRHFWCILILGLRHNRDLINLGIEVLLLQAWRGSRLDGRLSDGEHVHDHLHLIVCNAGFRLFIMSWLLVR